MAETTYNITLTANHQSLTAEHLPLAAESVQYLTAKVICETDDWTGREIKAMFGRGCTVYEVPVTGGEITAKQQLNLTAGDWRVWLVGNSARDGDVIPRITTNMAHISVAPTGGTEGSPFPTIPPTAEERLRADMGNLADLTTEDKSSLVAAINEVRQAGGGGVQHDWNQNDSTQPDYIKNRPFYTGDPVETVLVEESTVSFTAMNGMYMGLLESTFSATVGETYKVYWDGAAYECACVNFNSHPVIGNLSIMGIGSDTGEPFVIGVDNGQVITILTADTSASHTVSISGLVPEVVKIDKKYLPDNLATKSEVEVTWSTANAAKTAAENAQTTAENAQTTAENAQTAADAAQTTANAALERTVESYTRNAQMAPLYKNGGFFAWRGVVQEISYNETEGYFCVNEFDTTAFKEKDMPDGVFCVSVYVGGLRTEAFLTKVSIIGGSGSWYVSGFAIIIDGGSRIGEVLYVSSNNIPRHEAKGLFLTFRAPGSMLLKSSTANSTKQFRITVDDSGTLTATEVS